MPEDNLRSVSEPASVELPRVSVVMVTYNHERFIRQAIEGVVNQKARFGVELLIGEDCSTDHTRDIVREYAARYPHVVKAHLPEKNQGAAANFRHTLQRAQGEYIAFCEGDDFWTDPDKLQRQVDFLDAHPDCALCHHRVTYLEDATGKSLLEFPPEEKRKERTEGHELAQGNFIQNCAQLIRRRLLPDLGAEFEHLKLGDWPLSVLLSQRGWIGYLDRNMATFRLHGGGIWSLKPKEFRERAAIEMAKYLIEKSLPEQRGIWIQFAFEREHRLFNWSREQHDWALWWASSRSLLGLCWKYQLWAYPRYVVRVFMQAMRLAFLRSPTVRQE